MKTARQLDAERAHQIARTARLLAAAYHACLGAAALILALCAAAQLGVL